METKLIRYFLFILVLNSCTNSPHNIPFPLNETEFEKPKTVALGKPEIVSAKPLTFVIGQDTLKPAKEIKLGIPKSDPFNTNQIKLGEPTEIKFGEPETAKITNVRTRVCKPKTIILGQAQQVWAKPAHINASAITNLKFYSQDQGLIATIVQCLVYDQEGRLWLGTAGGLCMFDGHQWWTYSTEQGLSSNFINCLHLSREGKLLIGTLGGGLDILDEKKQLIKQYTTSQGLSNNSVLSVLESTDGKLFIGTLGGGLNILDEKKQNIKYYGKAQGISHNSVRSLLQSNDGRFFLGTDGGGLNIIDEKNQTIKKYTTAQGLSHNFVFSMHACKDGKLLFGTCVGGLSIFDEKKQTLKKYSLAQGLNNDYVLTILESSDGKLIIGTVGGGLNIIDEKNKTITFYSETQGLSNNSVFGLLESPDGKLLIGTSGGGLNVLDDKNPSIKHYNPEPGLSNNSLFSITESSEGKLLLGTYRGGLKVLDEKKQYIKHYTEAQGLSYKALRCLAESKNGKLFLGTDGFGLNVVDFKNQSIKIYSTMQGLSSNSIFCLLEDDEGKLLIGTYGGGLNVLDEKNKSFKRYTVAEGLSDNAVICLIQSGDGKLLIGTYAGGLNILDEKGHSVKRYSTAQGLSNNAVMCLLKLRNGKLLIGTDGGGLNIFDEKNKNVTHYTVKNGLPNDQVYSLKEDGKGNIYVGTGKGLCVMIPDEQRQFKLINYSKAQGLKSEDFNVNSSTLSKNGDIWFGTGDLFTQFVPPKKFEDNAPQTHLTSIDIMEKRQVFIEKNSILHSNHDIDTLWDTGLDTFYISSNKIMDTSYFVKNNISFSGTEGTFHTPKNLVLPFKQNHLTFHYSGFSIGSDAEELRYRFLLDGMDDTWSPITEKMETDYRNIPPGKYIFKIASRSRYGLWSKPTEFKFKVLPPWNQTMWAYAGYIILFVGSVFGFNNIRTRRLKQRQKELEETVEERTAQVVEQKNVIEEKHREITDSINYAERIQRSFLATKNLLDENLKDYFVFFQPKDVVSGDFYWACKLSNGNFALATADSTGHGVPGAIMSILNISSLEKAIEQGLQEPSEIFNHTRKNIIDRLKKDGSPEGGKDGMDCSLVVFDFKNSVLTYTAANNPVWIVRNNELIELNPDKMPVGKHDKDTMSFTQHVFELQKGDIVYTLTDGMPDQFGGPKGKKFMYKKLKELLISLSEDAIAVQKQKLIDAFQNWKGNLEQVDDVTIIGVRV